MSRRHRAEKREILPDRNTATACSKFINLMKTARSPSPSGIVYGALDRSIRKRGDPVEVFHRRWTT
jgi:ribosomal protein S7